MEERAARLTDGEKESGVAWNEKERRCVIEARGESKKRAGESKNKESPNQSAGGEIRKRAGTESESVQFAHHLVEMKDSVDGIAFRTVFGVTGHEFQHRRIAGHAA